MKKNIIFLISILFILSTCTNEPLSPLNDDIKNTINNIEDKDTDKDKDNNDPENQVSGHIIAKYTRHQWSPFTMYITYEKLNCRYTEIIGCNGIIIGTNIITEEKFNNSIYISSFLEGKDEFIEIPIESLYQGFCPHPEAYKYVQSTNKDCTVGYNTNGIIVDLYIDNTVYGMTDSNSRTRLISFSNIVN